MYYSVEEMEIEDVMYYEGRVEEVDDVNEAIKDSITARPASVSLGRFKFSSSRNSRVVSAFARAAQQRHFTSTTCYHRLLNSCIYLRLIPPRRRAAFPSTASPSPSATTRLSLPSPRSSNMIDPLHSVGSRTHTLLRKFGPLAPPYLRRSRIAPRSRGKEACTAFRRKMINWVGRSGGDLRKWSARE